MTIFFENTPNPKTRKFFIDGVKVDEPVFCKGADEVPELRPIFDAGAYSILFGNGFVSVTLNDAATWNDAEHQIKSALQSITQADVTKRLEVRRLSNDGDVVSTTIREIIAARVRPAVLHDGGDIAFAGYEGGIVNVYMHGACEGCPSSAATLKLGILRLLQAYVPEIKDVVPV